MRIFLLFMWQLYDIGESLFVYIDLDIKLWKLDVTIYYEKSWYDDI
jgi:hypothetical protein